MSLNLVSPGVKVREVDLTVGELILYLTKLVVSSDTLLKVQLEYQF